MLRGLRVKLENFIKLFYLSVTKRILDTNIKFSPQNLGAMLQYCYIERSLELAQDFSLIFAFKH